MSDEDHFEEAAREKVLQIAKEYGYGPVSEWLRDGWIDVLTEDGISSFAAVVSVQRSFSHIAGRD